MPKLSLHSMQEFADHLAALERCQRWIDYETLRQNVGTREYVKSIEFVSDSIIYMMQSKE